MTPTSKSPAVLSFNQIRQAIGRSPARTGPDGLMEECFHRICAGVLFADGGAYWAKVLGEDELGDHRKLLAQVYQSILGPQLSSLQAAVQGATGQVLRLWKSAGSLCEWLCRDLQAARDKGLLRYDTGREQWIPNTQQSDGELQQCKEISEPGWKRRVLICGSPETVWKNLSGEWCVLEFGPGSEDSAQLEAAAYWELLHARGPDARLVVARFIPEVEERSYTASELADARRRVRELAGQLSETSEGVAGRSLDAFSPDLEEALAFSGAPGLVTGPPAMAPAFLRYSVDLQSAARVTSLGEALQHRLRLSHRPFIQIDGTHAVLDIPRPDRQFVSFSSVEEQLPAKDPVAGSAWIPVGVDEGGRLRCANLAEPVHSNILVSGASGSGKTEWLRAAIAGLMARNTPETLRLLLIDPKHTAFADLKDSPFLLTPPVCPPEQSAAEVLAMLADEMEERLHQMAPAASIEQYVPGKGDRLPRIVCLCDEYGELAGASAETRRQVEKWISRLGANARLAGIHLIFATQCPGRDVLGGTLAANMSCRVAFKANSAMESRMAILQAGAERLLGFGDLLFRDSLRPVRLQGVLAGPEDMYRLLAPFDHAADGRGLVK